MESGRITDVTILSSRDDSDFLQRAESGVIPAILQAQSVNVSAVSGATYSSRGILEAVADALQLDTSALPEIANSRGHGKGGRDNGGTDGQNGPDSGTNGQNEPGRKAKRKGGKNKG